MTQSVVPNPTPAAPPPSEGFSPEVIAEVFGPQDAPAPAAPAEVKVDAKEAPTDPAKKTLDAPAEPKEKGSAERLAAAIRAEQRAERARVDLQTKKKELEATAEEIQLFQNDPAAFAAKKNWSAKQVAEFLEKLAGTHKPEAVQEKKLTAVEQELADLKKKLAADEAAKVREVATAQMQAAEQAAGQAFVAHIAGAVEKYPYVVKEFTEKQAVEAAFEALHEVIGLDGNRKPVTRIQAYIAQHGEPPSDEVIAEHLNSIAQKRIEARATAAWGKAGNAPTTPASQAPGESNSNAPQVTGASPRTLSRADTSTRAAAPRTKGNVWTAEDQAEADEASMRILAAATRKL